MGYGQRSECDRVKFECGRRIVGGRALSSSLVSIVIIILISYYLIFYFSITCYFICFSYHILHSVTCSLLNCSQHGSLQLYSL